MDAADYTLVLWVKEVLEKAGFSIKREGGDLKVYNRHGRLVVSSPSVQGLQAFYAGYVTGRTPRD